MTITPYLHYDVFTATRFEGNQLAVFPDARGMTADEMQTLAREMNFSESTFLLPAETAGTDIRMRIFTPGTELPMAPAGQTLAAAAALLARDDAALQAQAPAIDADLAAATQEHARVEGRVADLDALRAQLDPTTALDPATPAS